MPPTLLDHYLRSWPSTPRARHLSGGPVHQLPEGFGILEFPPFPARGAWTYATCGMADGRAIELHLFAREPSDLHVESLTVAAWYHHTQAPLDVGHTINLGRPWLPGSRCEHALISLPYLDGPDLEYFRPTPAAAPVRCLWLIPITREEREFKIARGQEALEARFEAASFDYLDPERASVI